MIFAKAWIDWNQDGIFSLTDEEPEVIKRKKDNKLDIEPAESRKSKRSGLMLEEEFSGLGKENGSSQEVTDGLLDTVGGAKLKRQKSLAQRLWSRSSFHIAELAWRDLSMARYRTIWHQ